MRLLKGVVDVCERKGFSPVRIMRSLCWAVNAPIPYREVAINSMLEKMNAGKEGRRRV